MRVLAFSGYSGSGKTTFIEQLVPRLLRRGLRVAVIKHDGHDFEIDHPGKDTWRFTQAGAETVVINSASKSAMISQKPMSFPELLTLVSDADLVLIEGWKLEKLPRIGVSRRATGKGLPMAPEAYLAVVTDEVFPQTKVPCFGLNDYEKVAAFIMEQDFTHFDEQGRARMVDVGEKTITHRTAVAEALVLVNSATFALIRSGGIKKGDVLTVAQIAGIMGAKRTAELIPMCHPVQISGVDLSLTLDEQRTAVRIRAAVRCDGRTGVEMEALTAVSTAALTVYDMCKAVQRDIVLTDIRLLQKTGGIHGDFVREETK